MASTTGRRVVEILTNKSGGAVAKGDVVIIDTGNNEAFTTTTSAGFTGMIGVAQEAIANNAAGRVCTSGYVDLVNVNASVTRGNFGKSHTVAKQATDAGSTRVAGTFCQFLTGGSTPTAHLFGLADTSATSSGALILLEQHSASAQATLDFTSWYSSTYDDYLFEILNLVPATANVDLFVRVGVAGSFDSTASYSNTTHSQSVVDGNVSTGASGTTAMKLRNAAVIDSNTSGGVTGSLKLWYPGSTGTFRRLLLDCSYLDGDPEQAKTWCEYTGAPGSVIDGVRFLFSSGNITSGIVRAYGIAKS